MILFFTDLRTSLYFIDFKRYTEIFRNTTAHAIEALYSYAYKFCVVHSESVHCIVVYSVLYSCIIEMYPMHTSNCSHVYLTKCKLDGFPVTLHHSKTLTIVNATIHSVHCTVQNTLVVNVLNHFSSTHIFDSNLVDYCISRLICLKYLVD